MQNEPNRQHAAPHHKHPVMGGAKNHPAPEAVTEAEISKQVQRIKELAHGMAPKQLRLMLKGDGKFFKKIARTANEDHLLACVLAEAKRVGIPTHALNPPPANNTASDSSCGKGNHHPEGKATTNRGKGISQNVGHNSFGVANKGKGSNHAKGYSDDQATLKGKGNKGKGNGKSKSADTPSPQHAISYQIVSDGWNVMPLDNYNGTQGGVFAIEHEEEARQLAESAANAPFPVAIPSPKPLGVGIGAHRPLDVEFLSAEMASNTSSPCMPTCISSRRWKLPMQKMHALFRSAAPPLFVPKSCTSNIPIREPQPR